MSVPKFIVKWAGKEFVVEGLADDATVLTLRKYLHEKTGVLPERQKLIGLKCKGKPATDEDRIRDLGLKENAKIMMVGSLEESITAAKPPEQLPEVIDDLEVEEETIVIQNRPEFLEKIQKRVDTLEVPLLNEPRKGKKLLVLDIDYTLFDHKSTAQTGAELMRPYLHEFLEAAYDDYDIAIWSATGMKWIDTKLKELRVTDNPRYKITFKLDSSAMISVYTQELGLTDVKPLGVIWGKFPDFYTPKNTIMFDDVSRNFLMNPQNGLKIRPFRSAHFNRDTDVELKLLSSYLKEIAKLEDLSELNHRKWERYMNKKRHYTSGDPGSSH